MGFSVHALRSKAKMADTGEIAADGKGVGASATWTFGDSWLDTQAQVTRLEAKVDSAASGKLENDATGKSLALDLEAGRRMPIAGGAFLTPRRASAACSAPWTLSETIVEVSDSRLRTKVEAAAARVVLGGVFPLFEGAASLRISAYRGAGGSDAGMGAAANVSMRFQAASRGPHRARPRDGGE